MKKNIEDVFKDTLGNYEADVNPAIWESVQTTLIAKGAIVSTSAKTGNILSGIGMKGTLWIASATIISVTGLFFVLGKKDKNPSVEVQKTVTKESNNSSDPIAQKEQLNTKEESVNVSLLSKIESGSKSPGNKEITAENTTETSSSFKGQTKISPEKNVVNAVSSEGSNNSPASEVSKNQGEETKTVTNKESLYSEPTQVFSEEKYSKQQEPAFDQIENYLEDNNSNSQSKLPNIFSPNQDGINDTFRLYTKGIKSLEVTIFNKTGQTLYKWSGTESGWNGRLSNGSEAEVGTYFYSIKAITEEGKICIKQSQLQLVR